MAKKGPNRDSQFASGKCKVKGCIFSSKSGHLASHMKEAHGIAPRDYSKRNSGIAKRKSRVYCDLCGYHVGYSSVVHHKDS